MVDALDRLGTTWAFWRNMKLAHQFALAGGAFTVAAMALCGLLTTTFVTESVIQQRGAATAVFMEAAISPLLRGAKGGQLAASEIRALDALMLSPPFVERFPYLEVWLPDGTLVYSNSELIVGRKFDLPQAAREAFSGNVVVTFTDLGAPEHQARGDESDFIEIYFPVRHPGRGDVAAIAELHEVTKDLEDVLLSVAVKSWITVAATCMVVMVSLFSVVLAGSRTIERQQRILTRRLQHFQTLNARNHRLKEEAQRASRSVTQLTDQHLRTIGADLHDGPAQTISFAVIKVEQVRTATTTVKREAALRAIETALADALGEIRDISRGLVLPDIESLTLGKIVDYAVDLHMRRTGVVVEVDNRVGDQRSTPAVSICVFRFVQEGLNNAFRHGLSGRHKVAGVIDDGRLTLAVTNQHRGGTPSAKKPSEAAVGRPGIGLQGLHARVQSINGNIVFAQGHGETRLEMFLDLREDVRHE